MTWFTVEAVADPVCDADGWRPLRQITDLVPGTILLEDVDEHFGRGRQADRSLVATALSSPPLPLTTHR